MAGVNKTQLTETDIITKFILPAVKDAGWDVMSQIRQEVKLRDGKVVVRGKLAARLTVKSADIVLYHKPGLPLAVIEAKVRETFILIPPFAEQQRIVAKVNELMSLCDQLEQQSLTSLNAHQQLVVTLLATLTDSQNAEELAENWERMSLHFDTLFTTEASIDALKQTILQLAVMGNRRCRFIMLSGGWGRPLIR